MGFTNNPPLDKFTLGFGCGWVLGFLGFLGVSAPSVNDLTGGADHPADRILRAWGFNDVGPLHRLILQGMERDISASVLLLSVMGGAGTESPPVCTITGCLRGFLRGSAPPADSITGGVDPLCDGVPDVGGFNDRPPPLQTGPN